MRRFLRNHEGKVFAKLTKIPAEAREELGTGYLATPVGWGDSTPNAIGPTPRAAWDSLVSEIGLLVAYDDDTTALLSG